MANSSTSTVTNHAAGGTALRGRIEAIGVFDLLRIAVTKGNTGRLLVFNDQFDAELYYVEGRLMAAVANQLKGRDALKGVFEMGEGEFEFAQDLALPETEHDATLHDVMMAAIKSHYQERVRARHDSSTSLPAAPKARQETQSGMPAVRISGTHLVSEDSRIGVAPIVSIEKPPSALNSGRSAEKPTPPLNQARPDATPKTSASQAVLLPGELGRATTDNAGRTSKRHGDVTAHDAALATLASKTAQSVASIIGMRDLQRFEIIGVNERALLCRVQKDGIELSVSSGTADFDAIWKELET
jgi:hypothetical protein